MSADDWSLISLLASCIEPCSSVEFMPLTDEKIQYHVYCHCEEQIYFCFNILEMKSIVNSCYSLLFSNNHSQDNEALNKITRVLLCCVSECLTSWNIRRRLLISGVVTSEEELRFSAMILRLKPKSEQIFRYRRFILKQQQQQSNEISPDNELNICDQTADAHHVNYGSWQHRRWIVEHLNIDKDEELRRNRAWLERHISDSSGHSFRAYLLATKLHEQNSIDEEFEINENLLKFYYDRESLWIYRQTLVFLFNKRQKDLSSKINKDLLRKEIDFADKFDNNMFAQKYHQLLIALLRSDGLEFWNKSVL